MDTGGIVLGLGVGVEVGVFVTPRRRPDPWRQRWRDDVQKVLSPIASSQIAQPQSKQLQPHHIDDADMHAKVEADLAKLSAQKK